MARRGALAVLVLLVLLGWGRAGETLPADAAAVIPADGGSGTTAQPEAIPHSPSELTTMILLS